MTLRNQVLTFEESSLLFFLLLGTFVIPYVTLLQPLSETMIVVKRELCAGFKEFVVGQRLGLFFDLFVSL